MIETLFTSFIWSAGLLLLLKSALTFGGSLLLDELTDEWLFCRNLDCETRVQIKLEHLGFTNFHIQRGESGALEFSAESRLYGTYTIKKEVDLEAFAK